ncbi:AQP3 [Ramazzottius varieornatus]|uniref:AQP3 n=1 Tax=Ramazzottius varieornatus TaxID=947166 RepID=A0A1D1UMT3_RAMVA|nr:AQP3 [Ramazzottius varieornatus]
MARTTGNYSYEMEVRHEKDQNGIKAVPSSYPTHSLTWRGNLARKLRIKNELARHTLAEFFSTFFLMIFIESTVASQALAGQKQDLLLIALGQGLGVTMGIYVSGGVSGAVLNPAIGVAFSIIGKLTWIHTFFYAMAQYAGSFLAASLVYGIMYEPLEVYDGGVRQVVDNANGTGGTGTWWATLPPDHRSIGGAFLHEGACTAFLVIGVLAITDDRNWKPHKGFIPFAIGMVVTTILLGFGANEPVSMNPARDFAPRMFALLAGYPLEMFSINNYGYFWIPIVATHLGAIIGALLYTVCIELHHVPQEEDTPIFPDEGRDREKKPSR